MLVLLRSAVQLGEGCKAANTSTSRAGPSAGNPPAPKTFSGIVYSMFLPTLRCRFGSFEVCKPPDTSTGRTGPSAGMSGQLLLPLVGYVIKHHHPDMWSYYGGGDDISMKGMAASQV